MSITTADPSTKRSATSPSVSPIPEGMRTVTPHLVCAGAANAIEFYKRAFNAADLCRIAAPDGKLMHAMIRIGDSNVMLVDEFPEMNCQGPKALKGTSVTLHLYVEDADSFFRNAVNAGATVIMPVQEMFWGDRYGILQDPFGHHWSVATHVRDLSPETIQEASKTAFCSG